MLKAWKLLVLAALVGFGAGLGGVLVGASLIGEEGVAVFNKEGVVKRMPTKARKVADVSGAGDTVISTLTMALSAGATIEEACYLANYAGGLVCEEVGIIPIEKDKLFTAVEED